MGNLSEEEQKKQEHNYLPLIPFKSYAVYSLYSVWPENIK